MDGERREGLLGVGQVSEEDIDDLVVKKIHELCKIIDKEPTEIEKLAQIATTIAHILVDMNINDEQKKQILSMVEVAKLGFEKMKDDKRKMKAYIR